MEIVIQFEPVYDEAVYEYQCFVNRINISNVICFMDMQTVHLNTVLSECEIRIVCKRKSHPSSISKKRKPALCAEQADLELVVQIHRDAKIKVQTRKITHTYRGEFCDQIVMNANCANLKIKSKCCQILWTNHGRTKFLIQNIIAKTWLPIILSLGMPLEIAQAVQHWGQPVAMNGITGTDEFFISMGMEVILIVYTVVRICRITKLIGNMS